MTMPLVAVVMGSRSDAPAMQATRDALDQLGVPHETVVMSAHRNPERLREYAKGAAERGIEVIIAGAGYAAHLPGVVASWTNLPVVGVPLPSSDLRGVDSLLAMVQMPSGVPVATVGIGAAGAKNAAYLAAQIVGTRHSEIREAYAAHRSKLAAG